MDFLGFLGFRIPSLGLLSVCRVSSSEAPNCVAMSVRVSIGKEKERKEKKKSPNGEMPRFGRFDSQVGSVRHSVRVASVHPFNQKLAAVQDSDAAKSEAPFTFELRSHIIILQLQIRTYRVGPLASECNLWLKF